MQDSHQNETILEAKSIIKRFGGVTALQDGNICIRKGKIGGLLGANGSGKTTLSRILTGIYQPTKGDLFLRGECVQIPSPIFAAENGIVMVHQHLSLIPELTVWENVLLGHEKKSKFGFLKDKEMADTVASLIGRFNANIDLEEQVKNLSQAKRQIVEIAKALSQEPDLLIFDEPTSALEKEEVDSLFTVMHSLKEEGVSMVFTSHRMWEVMEICDYVTVFRNGMFVGEIDFERDGREESTIVELITGKQVDQEYTGTRKTGPVETRAPVFGLQGIKLQGFSYPEKHGGISFRVSRGEIVGIAGINGQGQEELLLTLSGYVKPASGHFVLNDRIVGLNSPREAVKRGIVLVPGDRVEEGLFVQHDVNFNINFPFLSVHDKNVVLNYGKLRNNASEIIRMLSIQPPDETTPVENLSGGNQQKIVIGKWLLLEPNILLLSDPAKGVDVQAKAELYTTVRELAERGTAVILYASDNKELIQMCDRVFVMFEGSIVEELSTERLKEEELTAHSLRSRVYAEEGSHE